MFNPELDEATALQLCVLVNNQIEALKAWERKIKHPYLPQSNNVYSLYYLPKHQQAKPTMATAAELMKTNSHYTREMMATTIAFAKTAKKSKREA